MRTIYTIGIYSYLTLIFISSIFGNKKAGLWLKGRKNWHEKLKKEVSKFENPTWIHAASLGEFEQARPLIEIIKTKDPKAFIVLTFFSPSGFQIRKNYKLADLVIYLPLDSPSNARKFIKTLNPKQAIFIKYEFWFNYLKELKQSNVKTYLVSGIFRPNQHFFKWYGKWFRKQLSAFDFFFLQNKSSSNLLNKINYSNHVIAGDTRFDRVYQQSKLDYTNKEIESFCQNGKTLIFGSSWKMENDFAVQLSKDYPKLNLIIVPHEISKSSIHSLKNKFKTKSILLSEVKTGDDLSSFHVLIIDQIGLLSSLYRFGKIAIIGGGFESGIHNILEASVYGCPVLFGPNHKKFQEAIDLIDLGGAFTVSNYNLLIDIIDKLLGDEQFYLESSNAAHSFVESKIGATELIYQDIFLS